MYIGPRVEQKTYTEVFAGLWVDKDSSQVSDLTLLFMTDWPQSFCRINKAHLAELANDSVVKTTINILKFEKDQFMTGRLNTGRSIV